MVSLFFDALYRHFISRINFRRPTLVEIAPTRGIISLSVYCGDRGCSSALSAAPELLQRSLHSLFWGLRNDVDGYDNLATDRLSATLDAQLHRAVADDAMEIASEVFDVLFGYLYTLPQAAFIKQCMYLSICHVHGERKHDGAART